MKKIILFSLLFVLTTSCFARRTSRSRSSKDGLSSSSNGKMEITVKNETSVPRGWKFIVSDGKRYLTRWTRLPKKGSSAVVMVNKSANATQVRTVARFKAGYFSSKRIGFRVDLKKKGSDKIVIVIKDKKNLGASRNFVEIKNNVMIEDDKNYTVIKE